MERIYLDHAATTPLDREVLEKMTPYFCEAYGNADSPHAIGRRAMAAVDAARDLVARLIGAKSNEVYFTSGGTEADNWAVLGGAYARREEGRKRVVLSAIEHHAVLSAAERLEREGFEVVYMPVNDGGRVEVSTLETYITPDTALVALMGANNETGVLQPIREGSAIARKNGATFFTDCVQLAPYAPINVRDLGADMLAFSGHKFYGPKGVGVLYVKNGTRLKRLIGGGEQERGMRGGTVNVPCVVGLAAAYEKTVRDLEENDRKLRALSERFVERLSAIGGVERNGDKENVLPSVCNLRFSGVENAALLYSLDLQGICAAAGSACASASIKSSHVLTAMGLTDAQAKECVRFSLGKNNTEAEIDRAAQAIGEIVERLR